MLTFFNVESTLTDNRYAWAFVCRSQIIASVEHDVRQNRPSSVYVTSVAGKECPLKYPVGFPVSKKNLNEKNLSKFLKLYNYNLPISMNCTTALCNDTKSSDFLNAGKEMKFVEPTLGNCQYLQKKFNNNKIKQIDKKNYSFIK